MAFGFLERDVVPMRECSPEMTVGTLPQLCGNLFDELPAVPQCGWKQTVQLRHIVLNRVCLAH
jgi:hypothetical protein